MKKIIFVCLCIFFELLIVFTQLRNVLTGYVSFWYDPARDMLAAWDNLHKLTLIGQPSGIPGIFYGPYWIWLLSAGEIFSKDPRIVTLLIQTIPYVILFPLGLFLFTKTKIFDPLASLLVWVLFAYGSDIYLNSLWNPNLTPLLILFLFFILLPVSEVKSLKKKILLTFLAGILAGLTFQLQMSFGTGLLIGSILFLLIISLFGSTTQNFLRKIQHMVVTISGFLVGVLLTSLPFFLFEIRHGFMQTKTALTALQKGGGVVLLHGLTKEEILRTYFGNVSVMLHLNFYVGLGIVASIIIVLSILAWRKTIQFSSRQKQLLLLIVCVSVGVLGLYLSAKNPVWSYHFIGEETVVLALIGLLISKIKPLQYLLLIWVFYLTIGQVHGIVRSYTTNPLTRPFLYTKEYEVHIIQKDAASSDYAVYAYSPSIYTYDYSYIFKWLTNKDFSYDPGQIQSKPLVYLILPPSDQIKLADFIHYRTPDTVYKTAEIWHIPDGTVILRRQEAVFQKIK